MHDARDRVTAGRTVVGQQDDRPAVGRHLDRAQDGALAGQLAGRTRDRFALEPQPDAIGGGRNDPCGLGEPGEDTGTEPVGVGAGQDPDRAAGGGRGVSSAAGAPTAAPIGSTSPASTGFGPTPARVSVERDPRTGGTSIPPATAR